MSTLRSDRRRQTRTRSRKRRRSTRRAKCREVHECPDADFRPARWKFSRYCVLVAGYTSHYSGPCVLSRSTFSPSAIRRRQTLASGEPRSWRPPRCASFGDPAAADEREPGATRRRKASTRASRHVASRDRQQHPPSNVIPPISKPSRIASSAAGSASTASPRSPAQASRSGTRSTARAHRRPRPARHTFHILVATIRAYAPGCSLTYLRKFSRPIFASAASRSRSGYFCATPVEQVRHLRFPANLLLRHLLLLPVKGSISSRFWGAGGPRRANRSRQTAPCRRRS